jgi:GABA(A) receptor-associated protein
MSNTTFKFKRDLTLEQRTAESKRITTKFIDRLPVIVEKSSSASASLPDLDKSKYLVPGELNAGQFLYVVRKRLKLPSNEALYLMTCKGGMPSTSTLLSDLHAAHADPDGFLYLTYSGENVFG